MMRTISIPDVREPSHIRTDLAGTRVKHCLDPHLVSPRTGAIVDGYSRNIFLHEGSARTG